MLVLRHVFHPHASKIPEAYWEGNRSFNRPANTSVDRPVNRRLNSWSQTGKLRQAEDSTRPKDTGSIPDHLGDLERWATAEPG
jgi:hypothetical protein